MGRRRKLKSWMDVLKPKVSREHGVYNFRILHPMLEKHIIYDYPNYKTYIIEEIGMKNERFVDIPSTKGYYILSNFGRIFKKVLGANNRWEYFEMSDAYYTKKFMENRGGTNIYKYIDIVDEELNISLKNIDIGNLVAKMWVKKPKYIVFNDGLIESKVVIWQAKLKVCYRDNNGTNTREDNIDWAFHNDIMYKAIHSPNGNNTPPKKNPNKQAVFRKKSDGEWELKRVDPSVRASGRNMGQGNAHGNQSVEMSKGRMKEYKDFDGDIIMTRDLKDLDSDTLRVVENFERNKESSKSSLF